MGREAQVLVPGSMKDYINNFKVFDTLGVDVNFVMETVLYAWAWREQPSALYDLLSEQWTGEPGGCMEYLPVKEHFDDYYDAIREIIKRLAKAFMGIDRLHQNSLEYADIVGIERGPNPFFVVRFHYGL